jgi:hypothetical protein
MVFPPRRSALESGGWLAEKSRSGPQEFLFQNQNRCDEGVGEFITLITLSRGHPFSGLKLASHMGRERERDEPKIEQF